MICIFLHREFPLLRIYSTEKSSLSQPVEQTTVIRMPLYSTVEVYAVRGKAFQLFHLWQPAHHIRRCIDDSFINPTTIDI